MPRREAEDEQACMKMLCVTHQMGGTIGHSTSPASTQPWGKGLRRPISAQKRCKAEWQQNDASLPAETHSHNKRRKRKNDNSGSGSTSTALRDNTGIVQALGINAFYSPLSVGAKRISRTAVLFVAVSAPRGRRCRIAACRAAETLTEAGWLTKMAGRSCSCLTCTMSDLLRYIDYDHKATFLKMLNQQRMEGEHCDVVVVVENIEFRAHRCVLAACSNYFKKLFKKQSDEDNSIVELDFIRSDIFEEVSQNTCTQPLAPGGKRTSNPESVLGRSSDQLPDKMFHPKEGN
ncbi:hypothetical protein CRENBAI_016264 [Crenichthys baileyi]|uniref:BTB domain-containing protein n=1 Tax=Crenichthys baileyi TaxID=28760 RepID=A0AAV9RTD8_9TELE